MLNKTLIQIIVSLILAGLVTIFIFWRIFGNSTTEVQLTVIVIGFMAYKICKDRKLG